LLGHGDEEAAGPFGETRAGRAALLEYGSAAYGRLKRADCAISRTLAIFGVSSVLTTLTDRE
jgi:hypothetical protein